MSPFGREILQAAKAAGVKQAFMAKLLDITPGAVSQHYSK
jgi:predicted transcriptional regulator